MILPDSLMGAASIGVRSVDSGLAGRPTAWHHSSSRVGMTGPKRILARRRGKFGSAPEPPFGIGLLWDDQVPGSTKNLALWPLEYPSGINGALLRLYLTGSGNQW